MPRDDPRPVTHRRTAEEAVAQADAKARIRTAMGVRTGGVGLLLAGLGALARSSRRYLFYHHARFPIRAGHSSSLPYAIFGLGAVVLSPFVIVAGQLLLTRAIAAARGNPVTAEVAPPL
jgi:hypothetical protein